jgi:hypothetical protein
VLHGPAGVGKTRLAEEALRLAERGGRIVSRAVGHPATQEIPLGALAHLLPGDLTADLGVGDDERTGQADGAGEPDAQPAGVQRGARCRQPTQRPPDEQHRVGIGTAGPRKIKRAQQIGMTAVVGL